MKLRVSIALPLNNHIPEEGTSLSEMTSQVFRQHQSIFDEILPQFFYIEQLDFQLALVS